MNDQRNGGIAWTDFTANPIKYRDTNGRDVWACVKVSSGCANCYSATTAKRFDRGTDYNAAEMAKLTPYLDEKELNTLLKSTKISGKRVFVGDMTDIFGEWVSFDLLDRLFAVFALRPDVTFQILTKRPERMREYWAADRWNIVEQAIEIVSDEKGDVAGRLLREQFEDDPSKYPLPNVWPGVSVENQETADKRIPELLNTPAAKRFVSYEPALGPVDFGLGRWINLPRAVASDIPFSPVVAAVGIHRAKANQHGALSVATSGNLLGVKPDEFERLPMLDWVIVGGESGPGARPFDIEWARSTVRQCKAAGVPVFVKQVGSRPFCSGRHGEWKPKDRKGGDPSEWAEDLRVREFPAVSR